MAGRRNKLTGQIGAFLVCAELGKRELIATPFSGNVPKFDLIVADEQCRCQPIQVKGSNSNNWRAIANLWMDIEIDDHNKRQVFKGVRKLPDEGLIYVFVAISQTTSGKDRFFILKKKQLQELCVAKYRNMMDGIGWKRTRNHKSLDSRVDTDDLAQHEDQWDVIKKALTEREGLVSKE